MYLAQVHNTATRVSGVQFFTTRPQSLFLSLDTALPPREDYVQVDCVLKPRYKKCMEKEKDKDDSVKKNTVQGELKEG